MTNTISFVDSYGQKREFPRNHEAIKALKNRRPEFILPEILEVVDRIKKRSLSHPASVMPEAVGFELGIKIAAVKDIFSKLQTTGILGETAETRYPIERRVEEGDFNII